MNSRRHTLQKVVVIYLVAGLLVALLYLLYGKYRFDNINYGYEFADQSSDTDVEASIESTVELGADGTESEADTDTTDNTVAVTDTSNEDNTTSDEDQKHYYSYKTTNRYNQLRVRKGPDLNATILYRLAPGATGYVLEKGDSWSLIRTDKVDGYSSNSYLSFTELDKDNLPEDFPEDYR